MTRIAFTNKEAALFRLATDPAAADGERSAAAEALGRLLRARGARLEDLFLDPQPSPTPHPGPKPQGEADPEPVRPDVQAQWASWMADTMAGTPKSPITPKRGKRIFLATLCWIGLIVLAGLGRGAGIDFFVGVEYTALGILYATWNIGQGRKWYGVFLLLVPLYSTLLIGKMFWSWAGSWTHTTTTTAA
jgi:hypothetical protein